MGSLYRVRSQKAATNKDRIFRLFGRRYVSRTVGGFHNFQAVTC